MRSVKNKKWFAIIFPIFLLLAFVLQYIGVDLNLLTKKILPTQVIEPFREYPMNVHFMDVGKADSILITCNDKNILIDAADKDISNSVVEYLERESVKKIDLVVVTHPHRDHIGQMAEVVRRFAIVRFIMPHLKDGVMSTTHTYEDLLHALDEKNISPQEPNPGSAFKVGDMNVEIFAPNEQYDNINNYSVVTKITYGNKSFLFTGDAEKESENDMIKAGYNLSADVLKVGHHGSKTSTTQNFLSAVKPQYAVISVGDDKNNLPKKETLNRLQKNNIEVLRTDVNGNVIFSTDGEKIEIFKQKG